MTPSYRFELRQSIRLIQVLERIEKVFISFHHLDERYRDQLQQFIAESDWVPLGRGGGGGDDVSVYAGDIDDDLSDNQVRTIIRDRHVDRSSLIVVLVGVETYSRKYVDWEMADGLSRGCALLGLILPSFQRRYSNQSKTEVIPKRLLDNVLSGYASLHCWESVFSEEQPDVQALSSSEWYTPAERIFNDPLERRYIVMHPENWRPELTDNLMTAP